MKYFLVISVLVLLGNYLVATYSHVTLPAPNANSALISAIQSKNQLIESLTINLKEANLLEKLLEDTEKFNNFSATYTPSVKEMVNELRPLIITAKDKYFDAAISVYGWCSQALILSEALFHILGDDAETVAARSDIIRSLLDDDFESNLSKNMKLLSINLNKTSSSVKRISKQFDSDFTEQSELFQILLRHEIHKDRNENFDRELINTATKSLVEFQSNSQTWLEKIPILKDTIEISQTVFNPSRPLDLFNIFTNHANQKQDHEQYQQQLPHSSSEQMKNENPLLSGFQRAQDFFESFTHQFDDTQQQQQQQQQRRHKRHQQHYEPLETFVGSANQQQQDHEHNQQQLSNLSSEQMKYENAMVNGLQRTQGFFKSIGEHLYDTQQQQQQQQQTNNENYKLHLSNLTAEHPSVNHNQQLEMKYKNPVLNGFQQTKDLFKGIGHQFDGTQQQQHDQHYQQQLPNSTAGQMKYKNQVFNQFQQTREFFKSFADHLDDTLNKVNEIQSIVFGNKQPGQSMQIIENASTQQQQNAIKSAVQALKWKCDRFNEKTLSYQ